MEAKSVGHVILISQHIQNWPFTNDQIMRESELSK